ncbi:hypothetical protein CALVIDRAFT_526347 [Calocera viscosa TUFC12733]|uniref:DUF6593 domain-containing protein n=1 Tax=Calocera viscosa (strain TUFC12733) TaxID=1330018 RepID=A0A167NTD3_CALVF|nr:hypothetical protein CALVIDRAFT_526347 [Calocera viscosa TUFC12733]
MACCGIFNFTKPKEEEGRRPDDKDSDFLHFAISHDEPLNMTWNLKSGDMVYKCTTSPSHVSSLTRTAGGVTRSVGRIQWPDRGEGNIMFEFEGHGTIHLEDFLEPVMEVGIEHHFKVNDRELHAFFTLDRFVLTDENEALLGHDNRVHSGFLRRLIPDSFDVSDSLLNDMDSVFVAYICMERARREKSSAHITWKPYARAWKTAEPAMLSVQGPQNTQG